MVITAHPEHNRSLPSMAPRHTVLPVHKKPETGSGLEAKLCLGLIYNRMDLVSINSPMPSSPHSRPLPDCLKPPNGA